MRLERLRVENVRKIRAADLSPGAGMNVISGNNGSGKTSLLEAVYLLGNGRSFRTRRAGDLISRDEDQLRVLGEICPRTGGATLVGLEKSRTRTRLRVDGEDVRQTSALARVAPTVFIGPDCSRLLEESEPRRRFLDWVMFHVEPRYPEVHQRYSRTLRQRNAALRTGPSAASLATWDQQLADPGLELHKIRAPHVAALTTFASEFLEELLPISVQIGFRPGWDSEHPLDVALQAHQGTDKRLGYTSIGPHRADLVLQAGGKSARSTLSRGESKLFAMGLLLAQGAYFLSKFGEPPLLLVDDLGAELDPTSRTRFIKAMLPLTAQAFITTVVDQVESLFEAEVRDTAEIRQFHVEQGGVREVV